MPAVNPAQDPTTLTWTLPSKSQIKTESVFTNSRTCPSYLLVNYSLNTLIWNKNFKNNIHKYVFLRFGNVQILVGDTYKV